MKENIIKHKSFAFAINIINAYKMICAEKNEYVMSKQLLRSGTAIGALVRESEFAQSRADFIHKLHISLKETNETEYWLELLYETKYLDQNIFNSLATDCKELLRLLISITKSAKQNS